LWIGIVSPEAFKMEHQGGVVRNQGNIYIMASG
jgi:hypothetical protein